MSQALDEIAIGGLGSSRKRVEDDRFIVRLPLVRGSSLPQTSGEPRVRT